MTLPRVLFVLSNDYGELFNAMYFLQGTPVEAHLALPERLYKANASSLGATTYPYRGAGDLDRIAAHVAPELALLFSGYLLVVNRLLEPSVLESLVCAWRTRGLRLATTDPALGLLANITPETFAAGNPSRTWMQEHFRWLAQLLAETPHLYLAPEPAPSPAPQFRFFNPRFALERSREPASCAENPEPRWLFLISPEDFAVQAALRGRERFAHLLAAWLDSARVAGRRARLIAPRELLGDLAQIWEDSAVDYQAPQSFREFVPALLGAEFVFYWNMFSASILGRVAALAPFFTFDPGHLVRAMPPIERLGRDHFYAAQEVEPLRMEEPARVEELVALAERQRDSLLMPALERLQSSPPPEAVLNALLSR